MLLGAEFIMPQAAGWSPKGEAHVPMPFAQMPFAQVPFAQMTFGLTFH
jgi:hypothetical protein